MHFYPLAMCSHRLMPPPASVSPTVEVHQTRASTLFSIRISDRISNGVLFRAVLPLQVSSAIGEERSAARASVSMHLLDETDGLGGLKDRCVG